MGRSSAAQSARLQWLTSRIRRPQGHQRIRWALGGVPTESGGRSDGLPMTSLGKENHSSAVVRRPVLLEPSVMFSDVFG
jgi:hypothetical protein